MPDSARIEPTERSMPAIRIGKNSPSAIRTVIELCSRICTKLSRRRKYLGDSTENSTTMSSRMHNVP